MVFMLVASCNFALYFWRCARATGGVLARPEVRATMVALVGGGLLVALLLWAKGVYGPLTALRHGMFHVVSVATTTGFATVDYPAWPVFAPVFMLLLVGRSHQRRIDRRRHQDGAHADPHQQGAARN